MIKRGFDLLVSSVALFLLSPLLLALLLLVKLSSRGPVLHRGERIGRRGRSFRLLKFRSMLVGVGGPRLTRSRDPRVTRVGALLRRTKLDELPQLLNVLKGDMSLVGPRPEDPDYVRLYSPQQRRILEVRPGITSEASIRYRDEERELSGEDWEATYRNRILPEKLRIDLEYLERRSFTSDLGVLVRTMISLLVPTRRTTPPVPAAADRRKS